MVKKAPQMVNVTRVDGFTALHQSAFHGHKAIAETLLKVCKR